MTAFGGSFTRLRLGLLMLVALVLVAYAAASAWSLVSDYRRTLEAGESDARNLAAALEEHAANVFGETGRIALALSDSLPLKDGQLDAARARGLLSARLKRTPYLASLQVLDPEGQVLATTDARTLPLSTREDLEFHRENPLQRLYILAPLRDENHALIPVTTRLSTPEGEFAGIVEARIDADHFNLFYTSINIGTGGRIHLMRSDGTPLVEVPDHGPIPGEVASEGLLAQLERAPTGTVTDPHLGIVSYRRLARLPLVAMVSLSREETMAPWRARAVQQLMAGTLVMALVLALTALIWRQLGRLDAQDRALQGLVARRTEQLAQRNAELQRAYTELEEVSLTDQLTGLRNRRFLTQHIEGDVALALRRYRTWLDGAGGVKGADLLFFVVDLDHFKALNDRHGHAAGDRALKEVAQRLIAAFRESDYVVRWGGEEFLLVARGANREDAEAIAEKLREAVGAEPFALGEGAPIRITCSVGVACYPFLPRDPERLEWMQVVELADLALYQAKASGRNTWVGLFATEAMGADDVKRLFGAPDAAQGVKGLRIALGPRSREPRKPPTKSRTARAS